MAQMPLDIMKTSFTTFTGLMNEKNMEPIFVFV